MGGLNVRKKCHQEKGSTKNIKSLKQLLSFIAVFYINANRKKLSQDWRFSQLSV
jgi:hypothetical protein